MVIAIVDVFPRDVTVFSTVRRCRKTMLTVSTGSTLTTRRNRGW